PESEVNASLSNSAQSKKHDDKTKREAKGKSPVESLIRYRNLSAEFEYFSDNSINEDNADELEDITYSDDEDDVGTEADFNNLETSITVSPIPTTRVHKDHHKVWALVDLPHGKRVIGTKRIFRNKKDERGIVVRNKARLVAQGHTQEEGINYEEVFAPVARIEYIRLFLAYASFMGFMVYQMDVKSAFLYGTIEEEVYVCQPLRFEDPDYPDKVYKVVKALYGLHQATKAWYETLKKDGIFISHDKYVAEILRKFGLIDGKLASTPIDTEKPLLKDPDESNASEGFNQIIDFLNGSSIKYALTVNPNIYVSCIKQFWTFVVVKEGCSCLDDAEGIECLPNEEIFAKLARMGYEKPSAKLTFYKAFFSSQWKFLIPTILQCMSAKQTSWNEFSSSMASVVICLSTETPLFEGMIVEQQVDEGVDEVHDEDVYVVGIVVEGVVSAVDDEDKIARALEITKLKQRVKKLERRSKASKLQRLKNVGTAQRIKTSNDTVMDDVSKQGRIIADMDANKDVILEDAKEVNVEKSVDVLRMQDDEVKPAKLQEVVEVVTTAKLITEVVTAANTTITAAAPQLTTAAAPTLTTAPSASRRRKRSKEPKPLKKQAQIKQDKAYARELEAELNKNIDWDEVVDHVQRKQKEDNAVKRYQALKRKPQTKAQARKNMMIYLRNVAGFKLDYFKGMTYDDIRPIFEKHFDSNVDFLQKTKAQMDEEDSRALKRLNESQEDKAAKKKKLDKEVEELKRHLQIAPNDEDDVYTNATPLTLKVHVVDYEIYNEHNKP
nr:copia protein [Tanacetum cinerariifolium]